MLPLQALAESGGEPPLLWVAEELAQGVAARLRHHFAGKATPEPTSRRTPVLRTVAAVNAPSSCTHPTFHAWPPCMPLLPL